MNKAKLKQVIDSSLNTMYELGFDDGVNQGQAKYDTIHAIHAKLVTALKRIHDQAQRTNLVQDRSVGLIKQCLRYMERNAEQALKAAEEISK